MCPGGVLSRISAAVLASVLVVPGFAAPGAAVPEPARWDLSDPVFEHRTKGHPGRRRRIRHASAARRPRGENCPSGRTPAGSGLQALAASRPACGDARRDGPIRRPHLQGAREAPTLRSDHAAGVAGGCSSAIPAWPAAAVVAASAPPATCTLGEAIFTPLASNALLIIA